MSKTQIDMSKAWSYKFWSLSQSILIHHILQYNPPNQSHLRNIISFIYLDTHNMISANKIVKMASKWQKIAAASSKKISWSEPAATKGHFVVYTSDKRPFIIPLIYQKSKIFTELFRMAEEEFGVASDMTCRSYCHAIQCSWSMRSLWSRDM